MSISFKIRLLDLSWNSKSTIITFFKVYCFCFLAMLSGMWYLILYMCMYTHTHIFLIYFPVDGC